MRQVKSCGVLLFRRQPEMAFLLLRQHHRYDLPKGHQEKGESDLDCALRELEEETGYSARRWSLALKFWVSPGFLDETMAIYVARDLQPGKARPEEDEFIAKRFFPLSSAVRMATAGKIRDAKTIAGVLWLAERERRGR
jgi:ADP-ribose pyrophosphatase